MACLRSESGDDAGPGGAAERDWPHSPQKLSSGGTTALQWGQVEESDAPHLPQNFFPSGFWDWHLGHFIGTRPCSHIEDLTALSTSAYEDIIAHTNWGENKKVR